MRVRIRDTEACEPASTFIWDSAFFNRPDASGGYADWIMAGPDDPAEQRGGFRARMMLATSVLIQLFTDKRLPEGDENPGDTGDPRGWWGDSIKLPDEPEGFVTGSLLWTLERSILNAETAQRAKDYALDALDWLVSQGAASRFDVEVETRIPEGILVIHVDGFDHAGKPLLNAAYDVLWAQERNPAPMTYRSRI